MDKEQLHRTGAAEASEPVTDRHAERGSRDCPALRKPSVKPAVRVVDADDAQARARFDATG